MEDFRRLLLGFGAGPTGAGRGHHYLLNIRAWPTHLESRTRRSELTQNPQNITAGNHSEYLNPVRCLTSQSVVNRTQREAKHSIPPST
jgi:hypothetical protein